MPNSENPQNKSNTRLRSLCSNTKFLKKKKRNETNNDTGLVNKHSKSLVHSIGWCITA